MKKMLSLMLAALMMFSFAACNGRSGNGEQNAEKTETPKETENNAQETAPAGKWRTAKTTDEFGDVTADSSTVVTSEFSGSFSNTATTGSELTVKVTAMMEEKDEHPYFIFTLCEYNNAPATYTSSDEIKLSTKIDDTIFDFPEVISFPPNGNLWVYDTWETTYNALYEGRDVRCIFYVGSSTYNFTLIGDNFSQMCKTAGIITETVYYNENDNETIYQRAISFLEAGEFEKAIKDFAHLGDYKDSKEKVEFVNNLSLILTIDVQHYYKRQNYYKEHLSEYTKLSGAEIKEIFPGSWTYTGNTNNSIYTVSTNDYFSDWRVEGDKLIIGKEFICEVYHIYENAYVFLDTKSGIPCPYWKVG